MIRAAARDSASDRNGAVTRRRTDEAIVSFGGGPPQAASHGPALPAGPHDSPPGPGWRARLAAAVRVLHRVIGAPDYDAYLAHHARHHDGTPPLGRDEFVRRRQEDRYNRPGSRCC